MKHLSLSPVSPMTEAQIWAAVQLLPADLLLRATLSLPMEMKEVFNAALSHDIVLNKKIQIDVALEKKEADEIGILFSNSFAGLKKTVSNRKGGRQEDPNSVRGLAVSLLQGLPNKTAFRSTLVQHIAKEKNWDEARVLNNLQSLFHKDGPFIKEGRGPGTVITLKEKAA